MLYLICLLSFLGIKHGTSSFMLAGHAESVCVGSIMFNENSMLVFNTSVLVMDHQVSQVRLVRQVQQEAGQPGQASQAGTARGRSGRSGRSCRQILQASRGKYG